MPSPTARKSLIISRTCKLPLPFLHPLSHFPCPVSTLTFPSTGGLGFKRNDISTVLEKNLPVMNEKGMIFGYGINHEATNWNIRQEPGLIAAFEKLHDTQDLLVSFDGMNIQWPNR